MRSELELWQTVSISCAAGPWSVRCASRLARPAAARPDDATQDAPPKVTPNAAYPTLANLTAHVLGPYARSTPFLSFHYTAGILNVERVQWIASL